jgi:hypothetical protein
VTAVDTAAATRQARHRSGSTALTTTITEATVPSTVRVTTDAERGSVGEVSDPRAVRAKRAADLILRPGRGGPDAGPADLPSTRRR